MSPIKKQVVRGWSDNDQKFGDKYREFGEKFGNRRMWFGKDHGKFGNAIEKFGNRFQKVRRYHTNKIGVITLNFGSVTMQWKCNSI